MIRRIAGLLAAAAVIGIIVWTALGRGKYTSALFTEQTAAAGAPRQEAAAEMAAPADSLAMPDDSAAAQTGGAAADASVEGVDYES